MNINVATDECFVNRKLYEELEMQSVLNSLFNLSFKDFFNLITLYECKKYLLDINHIHLNYRLMNEFLVNGPYRTKEMSGLISVI
jgi:hypothetical protein